MINVDFDRQRRKNHRLMIKFNFSILIRPHLPTGYISYYDIK